MPESTYEQGAVTDDMVKRGADALAAWVNPTLRIGWAEQAARVVLDAALGEWTQERWTRAYLDGEDVPPRLEWTEAIYRLPAEPVEKDHSERNDQ